jgi:hypothetical protein
MPGITFSQSDILSGEPLDATWYKLTVKEASEETAKDGVSDNWVMDFIVSSGPKQGVSVRTWLNSKGPGMALRVSLIKALNQGKPLEAGRDYMPNGVSGLVGKTVEGYCQYDQAFKSNKVVDFRPEGGGVKK